ncbi:T9SS type A sorting domain-containing protein [Flavobacterium sp.]|uniref:T9SS type A sorting domain-containing protein n=1 Tax=Flavobacterium sp. TaxID=239 RepID=UPI0031E31AC0
MKKIYLFVFLLVCNFSFGQAPELGSYEVVFSGWAINDEHHNCGEAFVRLEFKKPIDNYNALNISYNDDRSITYYTYEDTRTTFRADKILQSMFFSASRYDRQSCRGNRPYNMGRVTRTDKFSCYDVDFEFKQFRNVDSDGDGLGRSSFNVKIRPVLVIANPGIKNDLPTETKIDIKSNTGFLPSEYNWQYSLNPSPSEDPNSSDWVDLPQYNTKSSFSANAVDILGTNTFNNVGNKIFIRQKACGVASNPVFYIIRLSAPIVNSAIVTQPTCSDTDDGAVKFVFDRTLYDGEQLNYTILDVTAENTPTDYNGSLAIGSDKSFTISGIRKGSYILQLIGFKDGVSTAVITDHYDLKSFTITSPPPLDFTLNTRNVQCYDAQDATITITPTGGTRKLSGNDYYSLDNGTNWIPFPNNAPYTITGLNPGTYRIKVKDMNGCVARVQVLVDGKIELGEEKVLEATITEPTAPLTLSYTYKQDPTFFGAFNGKITASISGGTIKDDKSYDYKWVKTTGEEFPATAQYNAADKTYIISLENVPFGEYKLTVTDKNYADASNKTNCSIIESSQILTQPDPIAITLSETQSISCNSENGDTETDKFLDGILIANATGGTAPYQYVWSKFNSATNVWDVLDDQTSKIAQNLSKGNYAVNVIDANGIVQGAYDKTELVTAIPAVKAIIEPIKLDLTFSSGNVSCHDGNNGWAKANVVGGMAPYNYTWFNVNGGIVNVNEITQLKAGEYFVEVTDAKGCFTKGSVIITEPQSAVAIEYAEIITPTFSGATNGKIVAEITGGTPNNDGSYSFEWKNADGNSQTTTTEFLNGKYVITLDGIPTNDYYLTIKDRNYNETNNQITNCSVLESKVSLTEPDPLKVVFEIVRSISCNASNEFGNDKDTEPKDGQRDESQDGILVAHVTGGTPLASSANNGLPYFFYWKKQQTDGSWFPLSDIQGETASNLSHGNYALNVKDRNGIVLGTYVNNVLTQEIDATQFMQESPKLSVSIAHGDVFCNGGNDGWATANVVGGTPPYEYKWSNDVETDKNTILKAGEYWVFITDAKGCTTQESVTIIEPIVPLRIKYTEVLNPSFYKATNGKIIVEVTGGTISANNTYWYEWKNSKGEIQTASTNFNNGIYTISLNNLPEETYTLNVHDANYDAATNKSSCNVSNSVVVLDDPDPLEVTFEIKRTISCNASNEFGNETDINPQDNQRDESQDGILTAHVKGGIQLQADKNNGLPYFYNWKKKQNDGSWKVWNEKTETLNNISEGTYALNIEDANGIKLGTYTNNILVKETDAIQYMAQPAKLNLTFTKLNARCNNGDDGWAEAHVSGGTAPYKYEWTNGETTAKIENITTNNYFVLVTDAKGCVVQGSIFVGDPKGIFSTETVKNPTCYNVNDGSIVLNVTGGNLPYSYVWNTGAITKDLNNLPAGNYEVTISCPDCCVYKKKFTLKNPDPIVVDLGKDRTLCDDQVLELDASIADKNAQYSWTSSNGFTSNQATVSLTKAGTYHVKATSALGCVGEDEIVIKTRKAVISSEFLLSSQAYIDEEVILVNTSNPFGESTNWIIPEDVITVEQKEKYITLRFDKTGTYTIGLQQTQDECFAIYNKNITVEKRSTLPNGGSTAKSIIDFIVTPNPSNGNFKAIINLENNSAVNLRLFSTTGEYTMQKKDSGKKNYEVDFNTSLQSGIYILVLETEQQTLVKKIIIY